LAILRAAVEGGRRGEIRLYWGTRGLAARAPALYVDPVGGQAA
jgi:hypothetical protein